MNDASRPYPNRVRPYSKTQAPTPLWLKPLLGRELAPSADEYQRLAIALWDGDPPMDTLVDWLFETDTRHRQAQIQQAIQQGPDSLTDCPAPIRAFFGSLAKPPAWIKPCLIEEGAQFIHSTGASAGYVLRDLALMGGYMLSGFNQALIKTGALNKGTSQRIAETAKWWMDCTEPQGLQPFRAGFSATLQVRLVHAMVRRGLNKRADWDHRQWGLPLNQVDMCATYLGFSVVMLVGLRKLGLPILPRESKAVIHLWSYACWLMGVEERWLVQSEREGFILLNQTYMTQTPPDDSSRELALALAHEPLERRYDAWQTLRRRLAYHQHLGMSHYFLGRQNLQRLGFEATGLPWYPLLSNVPRAAAYTARHFLPGQRKRQQQAGRRAQKAMMAAMFGEREHRIISPNEKAVTHL